MSQNVAAAAEIAHRIADEVEKLEPTSGRRLIAIAGAPGAGKTTVAELTRQELERRGVQTGVLPMDGFHYDNAILVKRGLLDRKGAPETFDVAGLRSMLERLQNEKEVAIPEFDRVKDFAIMARSIIDGDQNTVIVEGNYLFLGEPPWSELAHFWTYGVFLDVPMEELEARLVARWIEHGLEDGAARERALSNDIPNAQRTVKNSSGFDIRIA